MKHPIGFAQLADWVDGRLSYESRLLVEEHLATGCPECAREVAWLQRVLGAAKADNSVEPPPELVSQAQALFRSRFRQPAGTAPRLPAVARPRLALALAVLFAIIAGSGLLLSQIPSLFVRHARLTALDGSAEVRTAGSPEWRGIQTGASLTEGDRLRVLDGVAVVALFDGSILKLQRGADLGLAVLRSGLFSASRRVDLSQLTGSVDYDVTPLSGVFSSFEATAPTVRVEVRGTRFVIDVRTSEETTVSVLQGAVLLVNEVQSTVLAEREVAVVPANALAVLLPTLLPTETPLPRATATPTPTSKVMAAATPQPMESQPVTPRLSAQPTMLQQATSAVESILRSTQSAAPVAFETHGPFPSPTGTSSPEVGSRTPSVAATGSEARTATPGATGTLEATPIPGEIVFHGKIERFPSGLVGVWHVGGRSVIATSGTRILGRPEIGLWARVVARLPGPAELGRLVPIARLITIDPRPPETLHPTATGTLVVIPSPWLTHTAPLTLTPELMDTPGAAESPVPTRTGSPADTAPAATDVPTNTAVASRTPHGTGAAQLSHTPGPSFTPSPTRTLPPTRTSVPTFTPEPTPTVQAAATPPEAHLVRFGGKIDRLPPQRSGIWVIAGRSVVVLPETKIDGQPNEGLLAEVEAWERPNEALHAIRITILPTTAAS
jgi:hypothetical protein